MQDGTDYVIPRIKALDLYAEWEAEFKPLLGHTARWEAFSYIVRDQLLREKPVIVETGTLREPGNWVGDGCSTLMWDWIAGRKGMAVSVDANCVPVAMATKLCPNVDIKWMDSIKFLRYTFKPTLLYLDSYDYSPGKELNAAMHQVAELAAIWEHLPSGCLIASDDNHSIESGKGVLVRRLLHAIGIEPVIDSYILVWRKP